MVSVRIAACLLVVFLCSCPVQGQSAADAMFLQIIALFTKHGCPMVPSDCSAKFSIAGAQSNPSCDDVRKSGQCMFNDCSDIKGSGDDTAAADILVQYADNYFNCTLQRDEVIGNGGSGLLQRPVWESLGMLLAAALAMAFFKM